MAAPDGGRSGTSRPQVRPLPPVPGSPRRPVWSSVHEVILGAQRRGPATETDLCCWPGGPQRVSRGARYASVSINRAAYRVGPGEGSPADITMRTTWTDGTKLPAAHAEHAPAIDRVDAGARLPVR